MIIIYYNTLHSIIIFVMRRKQKQNIRQTRRARVMRTLGNLRGFRQGIIFRMKITKVGMHNIYKRFMQCRARECVDVRFRWFVVCT